MNAIYTYPRDARLRARVYAPIASLRVNFPTLRIAPAKARGRGGDRAAFLATRRRDVLFSDRSPERAAEKEGIVAAKRFDRCGCAFNAAASKPSARISRREVNTFHMEMYDP